MNPNDLEIPPRFRWPENSNYQPVSSRSPAPSVAKYDEIRPTCRAVTTAVLEAAVKIQNVFDVIYTHTEGEPLCIINGGIPYPYGSSILEKRKFLEENYDWVRCALMREPRGHRDMFGVFL